MSLSILFSQMQALICVVIRIKNVGSFKVCNDQGNVDTNKLREYDSD